MRVFWITLATTALLGLVLSSPLAHADDEAPGPGEDAKAEHATPAPAEAAFAHLDLDGDGRVTWEEYEKVTSGFAALDADGDGAITKDELRKGHPPTPFGGLFGAAMPRPGGPGHAPHVQTRVFGPYVWHGTFGGGPGHEFGGGEGDAMIRELLPNLMPYLQGMPGTPPGRHERPGRRGWGGPGYGWGPRRGARGRGRHVGHPPRGMAGPRCPHCGGRSPAEARVEEMRVTTLPGDGTKHADAVVMMPGGGDLGGMAVALLGHRADADGDRRVTKDEWKALLESLGADENGELGVDALKKLAPGHIPPGAEVALRVIFDADENGRVELQDLQALFGKADANGDGVLTADELVPQGMRTLPGAPGAR